jgi:hypothetical protein
MLFQCWHEGLPPLYPAELDQLDHAPGTAARINNRVDSIGFEYVCVLEV